MERSDVALRPWRSATLLCAALLATAVSVTDGVAPRFYSDDPLTEDPETQDASGVQEIDLSDQYDFVENSFLDHGDTTNQRDVNVTEQGQVGPPHCLVADGDGARRTALCAERRNGRRRRGNGLARGFLPTVTGRGHNSNQDRHHSDEAAPDRQAGPRAPDRTGRAVHGSCHVSIRNAA